MRNVRRKTYLWLRELAGNDAEMFAPHGVPVQIPKHADLSIRYLMARGRPYEMAEAEMIRAFLKPGTNVIELGGSMGVISALIRDRIGPKARHIVVEADPVLAEICALNARRGTAEGITDVVVAAVDYSGAPAVTFAVGKNAHVGHVAGAGEGGITVPTITLSELASRLPDGPFALVCDIEGAECALFEAERALLQRICLIVVETHPRVFANGEADLHRVNAAITGSGMRLLREMDDVACYARS
jgi:FkbM family methyltransferase